MDTNERQHREWLIDEIRHQSEILATYGIVADVVDDSKLSKLDTCELEGAADRVVNQVYDIDD